MTKGVKRTESMVVAAIFAALTGVLSWISIPLPFTPVPANLALAGVMLGAVVMSGRYGKMAGVESVAVYILMGAIGLPVFSGGTSGLGVILGPTGGFIIGYAATALWVGFWGNQKSIAVTALMNMIGIIWCYAFGLLWFMQLTGQTLVAGISACVLPFIVGDVLKSIFVAYLGRKIKW